MNRDNIKEYALELLLQILKTADNQIKEYEKIGDISAIEILKENVIKKYEALYLGVLETDFSQMGSDQLEFFEKTLKEISEKNNIDSNFILKQLSKRNELRGVSGAEVVENLLKYELSKLLEAKQNLVEKIEATLVEEEKLENQLKDAIQEQEQFDIIYELSPVRSKFRSLETKLLSLEENILTVRNKLDSRWPYEIYGTISKDELLKVYKDNFNMGE